MSAKFISIQDASELSTKSVQTIRRAIKSKKIKFRKKKTAQGFNYLVEFESLVDFYKLKLETPKVEKTVSEAPAPKAEVKETVAEVKTAVAENNEEVTLAAADFKSFTNTLEKMITQHADERQNFLRLVNTLQEKVFVLENQINLLQAPKKKWYQFK